MGYRSAASVNPGLRPSGIPRMRRPSYAVASNTTGRTVMRRRCRVLLAVALVGGSAGTARALDMAHVSCHGFLASGHDNMAAIIMWLRGYHAGKSGLVLST